MKPKIGLVAGVAGIIGMTGNAISAFAQQAVNERAIPETSVVVGSFFMLLIGSAILALLGAFIVKLATSWICGEAASYGQGYKTFFLANLLSSAFAISVPMFLESVLQKKLHPAVIAIGAILGLATWPFVYGKLISIGEAKSIGLKKGLWVSLIMAVANGIIFLFFGGSAMFTK